MTLLSSYLILNKHNTSSKWFFILFFTRCLLRDSHIICIQKARCSNEINFNICPHTNFKCNTRWKFAKIKLRMVCLGQKFITMRVSPCKKIIGTYIFSTVIQLLKYNLYTKCLCLKLVTKPWFEKLVLKTVVEVTWHKKKWFHPYTGLRENLKNILERYKP